MNKQGRWNRRAAILLAAVMLIGLLSACSGNNSGEEEQERVLRIAYSGGYNKDYGDFLRVQFTEIFEWINPKIKVEFVENVDTSRQYDYMKSVPAGEQQEKSKTPMELLKEELDGSNPPDVIIMEYRDMKELVRENRLISLESLMQKSEMKTEEFVPSVLDAIKKQSDDGKLYALAPLFSSSVLVYNKKLFTDANVPFPTDGMTWEQTFDLARQVSKGEGNDRIYGLTFTNYRYSDGFYDTSVYSAPLDLRIWDEKGEKMLVNTPDWINVWTTIKKLKDDKILPEQPNWNEPQPEQQNPFNHNSLLSGKVAMSIINEWELTEIINANRSAANIENFTPVDWDVVSVPFHESAPNVGGNVNLNGIMGITSNAQNQKDAWAFIEFIMSERWAQQKSKSVQQLVTWKKYNEPRDGLDYNMEAFFRNTPVDNFMDYNDLWQTKPDIGQAQWIGQTKFQEVMSGNKTVEEALKEWETEGDAILQKLKENDGRLDPNFGEPGVGLFDEKRRVMEAAGDIIVDTNEAAPVETVEEAPAADTSSEAVTE